MQCLERNLDKKQKNKNKKQEYVHEKHKPMVGPTALQKNPHPIVKSNTSHPNTRK